MAHFFADDLLPCDLQVYGTNFDQWFPEIHWQYGYIYFWGTCECGDHNYS